MFQFKNSNTMLSCHHIRLLREKKTKAMYFQSNVLKSALQFFFQDIITFHVIIAASIFFSPTKNGIKSQLSPLFVPPREMRKKISLFTKGGRSRYGHAYKSETLAIIILETTLRYFLETRLVITHLAIQTEKEKKRHGEERRKKENERGR